jgi:hypothetical protein
MMSLAELIATVRFIRTDLIKKELSMGINTKCMIGPA